MDQRGIHNIAFFRLVNFCVVFVVHNSFVHVIVLIHQRSSHGNGCALNYVVHGCIHLGVRVFITRMYGCLHGVRVFDY